MYSRCFVFAWGWLNAPVIICPGNSLLHVRNQVCTKPSHGKILAYYQWDYKNEILWNLNKNTFFQQNTFENVIGKLSAMFFMPKYLQESYWVWAWSVKPYPEWFKEYRQTSNIRRPLLGNIIVDHSDVVGASHEGAAPTTSSFSTRPGINGLGRDNCKARLEHAMFCDLMRLILGILAVCKILTSMSIRIISIHPRWAAVTKAEWSCWLDLRLASSMLWRSAVFRLFSELRMLDMTAWRLSFSSVFSLWRVSANCCPCLLPIVIWTPGSTH